MSLEGSFFDETRENVSGLEENVKCIEYIRSLIISVLFQTF